MVKAYDPPRELWLYDDRCMKKWQGFFLSDHTQALDEDLIREAQYTVLPEQSDQEVRKNLYEANLSLQDVLIQLKVAENECLKHITGDVEGFTDNDEVVVYTNHGREKVQINLIGAVTEINTDKWYERDIVPY